MRSGDLARPPRYRADTSRPADIKPFLQIPPEEWLEGEVTMMSNWAVFAKVVAPCGEPFVGVLYQEEFAEGFDAQVIRGYKARVRIKEVDTECRRLLLTMKEP
mmetsp:Transcript_67308/g.208135  ORF Transcript_67308/g.208135 Transcript_67308/m.208135 type:complete len:103 (+) Transcript_67308:569-877(+)